MSRGHDEVAEDSVTIAFKCPTEPEHSHEYPNDWIFAGPSGTDPRADLRWESRQYEYYDSSLNVIDTRSTAICDDQALDEFTVVANQGPDFQPVYIGRRLGSESNYTPMPWKYDKQTDMVVPFG